ncbi:MAG TPA: response regulator transcription factor [Methylomirabilota bacterium]|jgi:DNA-binding NarL/FixJ family response regulator|nr:response regulator transcription factor [Methylomirabilota bacterium]
MSVRILLVDDHQLVREGLRALLEREQFQVVGEAADGHDAIKRAQALRPDVAVLDLSMPQLNGLDAAREMSRAAPGIKVIALTVHTEDPYVISALRAGIKGYVLKSQATADLVQAIREVSKGMTYLSPGISRAVVEAYLAKTELPPDPLTGREREVLQLVAEGRTTKEIAQRLGISVKTADSHRTRIMRKLDIHATAGLVRHAIRVGLIQP